MKTRFLWITAAMLSLALIAQFAHHLEHTKGKVVAYASWRNRPARFEDARKQSKAIRLAKVVAVERGEDLVTSAPGEPNNEDRIPTQKVTMEVVQAYKAKGQRPRQGERFTLFQTGGTILPPAPASPAPGASPAPEPTTTAVQFILEGDPPYKVGEQHLLLLEDGPRGMLRTIAPEGRYQVDANGTLTATVDSPAAKEVHGKKLREVENKLGDDASPSPSPSP